MLESKLGKLLVIAYTLLTIVAYAVSYSCGTGPCSLSIVVPIMPWAFIFSQDLGLQFPWAVYPVFVLLNASVAYVVGAGVEWLYTRVRSRV